MTTSYSWNLVPDNTPPVLSAVQVLDGFTLRVIYSKAVVVAQATVPANYGFDNGLVAQSVVSENSFSYLVTTSQQTPATSYLLTVSNVQDLFGNTI